MRRHLTAVLCLVGSPAVAWTETKDFRGLHVYHAAGDGVEISVVCDPEGAFIPPAYHIEFLLRDQSLSGDYILSTPNRRFAGTIALGTLTKSDRDAWDDVIAVFRSGSAISISVNGSGYSLDTEQPLPSACA